MTTVERDTIKAISKLRSAVTPTIAAEAEHSHGAVLKALRKLEAHGLVRSEKSYGRTTSWEVVQ